MAALRRTDGFIRYALAIQYHGSRFLGFSYQGERGEDCITPDGTDLRGFRSVEGRLREALGDLVGADNYENIQVSSRTDRGVHALKNTLHVDIRPRSSEQNQIWDSTSLVGGLNSYLVNQGDSTSLLDEEQEERRRRRRKRRRGVNGNLLSGMQDLRVLNAARAPETMNNAFYNKNNQQPPTVDWNARFSATQRTYIYRILQSPNWNFSIPFEWDRSLRLRGGAFLDIDAMNDAGQFLEGTHDFSSFRGASCQRASPIVTINQVTVQSLPYDMLGLGLDDDCSNHQNSSLVTIKVVGDSFVYRQVRNMVGCLLEVGRQRITPAQVKQILSQRDRSKNPTVMGPAHGLFLVDVKHGDFVI
jgi:tRNA pseudouridine38-40 synthase